MNPMVAFSNPFGRPWHYLALELVVLACFALTVRHAVAGYRRGERHHAFQFVVIILYGLMMEVIAFNAYQNYVHAQFTVQFYDRQLPLYVTLIYVVFHYTGLKMVERLRLPLLPEALLVGFAICTLDFPFDIVGAQVGWWRWSDADPNLAYRWLGVPVTSYYWYLLFGAILAVLCRFVRPRLEKRTFATQLAFAPLVAASVIVIGILAFIPFHVVKRLGVADGTIVAAHLTVCAIVALTVRARDAVPFPKTLLAIPLALHLGHVIVFVAEWSRLGAGGVSDIGKKSAALVAAACAASTLAFLLPVRGRLARRDAVAVARAPEPS
jgi:hypothetical protein